MTPRAPLSLPRTGLSPLAPAELERLDQLRASAFVDSRDAEFDDLLATLARCAVAWINIVPSYDKRAYEIDTYDDRAVLRLINAGLDATEEICGSDRMHVIRVPIGPRQCYARDDVLFLLSVIDRLK